jgi:hypothetical protein
MSVSDDSEEDGTGGGSLQIWRINDLIWRPEREVLAELEMHRSTITSHKDDSDSDKPATVATHSSKVGLFDRWVTRRSRWVTL